GPCTGFRARARRPWRFEPCRAPSRHRRARQGTPRGWGLPPPLSDIRRLPRHYRGKPPGRKVHSSWSWLILPDCAGHDLGARDIFRLRGFVASGQQEIDSSLRAHEINPVAGADMHAHFRNPFADGFTVAEVAERGATQAREDA